MTDRINVSPEERATYHIRGQLYQLSKAVAAAKKDPTADEIIVCRLTNEFERLVYSSSQTAGFTVMDVVQCTGLSWAEIYAIQDRVKAAKGCNNE